MITILKFNHVQHSKIFFFAGWTIHSTMVVVHCDSYWKYSSSIYIASRKIEKKQNELFHKASCFCRWVLCTMKNPLISTLYCLIVYEKCHIQHLCSKFPTNWKCICIIDKRWSNSGFWSFDSECSLAFAALLMRNNRH